MNLKTHANAGCGSRAACARLISLSLSSPLRRWGYSGPLTKQGVPDVTRHVFVDPSRPLPDEHQDVRSFANTTVRGYFEELEPRLRVFGYTLHAPFVTDCDMATRRAMSCAPAL